MDIFNIVLWIGFIAWMAYDILKVKNGKFTQLLDLLIFTLAFILLIIELGKFKLPFMPEILTWPFYALIFIRLVHTMAQKEIKKTDKDVSF